MSEMRKNSPELAKFLQLRGDSKAFDESHLVPTTPDELEHAEKLMEIARSVWNERDFASIWPNVVHQVAYFIRDGKITEEQYMEFIRDDERRSRGETYEETAEKRSQTPPTLQDIRDAYWGYWKKS